MTASDLISHCAVRDADRKSGRRVGSMITLRIISSDDVDFMMRLVLDSEVTKYLPAMISNRHMMEGWICNLGDTDHEYIVVLDGTDIGECSLAASGDSAEIGFTLLPEYWNYGYGTEVVSMLIDIASGMDISSLSADTDERNVASKHILEKSGFEIRNIGWLIGMSEENVGPI